ncbi:MAG TPA: cyanophycinase [Gemmatimonadaceae bacterium]|jgi:cyanophycinase
MSFLHRSLAAALVAPVMLSAQSKVGPVKGTVIVVGGGAMGPEVYQEFIKSAGGPDALIIDVPTAGGDSVYTQDAPGTRGWKNAGAKNIYVYHTKDRKLADSDSFVAVLKKAGGIWFEGGRQFHIVDSFGGTKSETEFMNVLKRGGVIAGSSAGASILGDFLVRGAPSNNNFIMDDPGYEKGFAYLRGVGIDQHVVARERLADLADSIIPKYPNLLAISEDEGTAWVVRGDTAMIIGRNKAFVYNGKEKDAGKPFLTLFPGDHYNLATRMVTHRVATESPVKMAFLDSLFGKYNDASAGGATVLIAQNGKVFTAKSYGIAAQAKFMPTTTVPLFPIGDIKNVFTGICDQLPAPARGRGAAAAPDDSAPAAAGRGRRGNQPPLTALQTCVAQRISTPIGMHKTNATADGVVMSDVDELYRLSLGLDAPATFSRDSTKFDGAKAFTVDSYKGTPRLVAYGMAGGKKDAFVRIPDRNHTTIIVLTNDDSADAKGIADRIMDKILSAKK